MHPCPLESTKVTLNLIQVWRGPQQKTTSCPAAFIKSFILPFRSPSRPYAFESAHCPESIQMSSPNSAFSVPQILPHSSYLKKRRGYQTPSLLPPTGYSALSLPINFLPSLWPSIKQVRISPNPVSSFSHHSRQRCRAHCKLNSHFHTSEPTPSRP